MRRFALATALTLLLAGCNRPVSRPLPFPDGFAWGAATSAYQVEGSWDADGKGRSVWDTYTNELGLLGGETANVSIDQVNRFVGDVALLKAIGVTHHRFSIAWTRILPEGVGTVNQAGIDHYGQLIDTLIAAGIQPVVTLHHRDYPQALADRGGWSSRESVAWFEAYARIVFEAFGDRVPLWITLDEPYADQMLFDDRWEPEAQALPENETVDDDALSRAPPFVQARRRARATSSLQISGRDLATRARKAHHWLLAHARAVEAYRDMGLQGQIGLSLDLTPVYSAGGSPSDSAAARIEDGIRNRWFLDPVFRGAYPEDILTLYGGRAGVGIEEDDAGYIGAQGTDFVGVTYRAPTRVEGDTTSSRFGVRIIPNPDFDKSYNGEANAEGVFDLLTDLDARYDRPVLYLTAVGAGFGPLDELVENGRVRDELRLRFLRRHFVQAQYAITDGVDLRGLFVWSAFDGFDWDGGFEHRHGIIRVDFETQERLYKDSARYLRGIIEANAVSRLPF